MGPQTNISRPSQDGVNSSGESQTKEVRQPDAKPSSKPKSRKRVNTAEKRATHNAVERQRREMLNTRFLDLARLLPSLAKIRRPSKSAIVNGSINHLDYQRNQRLSAARELRRIFEEKDELLEEVNQWRNRNGMALKRSQGWTREMEEILAVEEEVFGQFSGMGTGDGDGDGEGEGEEGEGDMQEMDVNESAEQSQEISPADNIAVTSRIPVRNSISVHQDVVYPLITPDLPALPNWNNLVADACQPGLISLQMPHRQQSFAETEMSSAISGSSPQLSFVMGPGSPIDSDQRLALQAFLSGGDMFAQGPLLSSPEGLSGDCVTPPQDVYDPVTTFIPPSPPVAATSFSTIGKQDDKVSQWAAQQIMLQYSQDHGHQREKRHSMGSAGNYSHQLEQMAQMRPGSFPQYSTRLGAAHQALLTHQPQLAAAAFPPPYAESNMAGARRTTIDNGLFGHSGNVPIPFNLGNDNGGLGNSFPSGLTYSQIEQWSRFGQTMSRSPMTQPETLDDFRQAVRTGISMGLAAGMARGA